MNVAKLFVVVVREMSTIIYLPAMAVGSLRLDVN